MLLRFCLGSGSSSFSGSLLGFSVMSDIDNSGLIYDYTEKLYNARSLNIDALNIRITAVLVTVIGLMKLVTEIPHVSTIFNYQLYARCGSFGFAILCVSLCFLNFFTRFRGGVADPYVLADDYIDRDPNDLRCFVVGFWARSIVEYEDVIAKKASLLNIKAFLLFLSLLLFSIAYIPLIIN
jgi:hypothetical protein